MVRGYDGVYHLSDMDDGELAELIVQELDEMPDLDPDLVEVEVVDGFVRLTGRVGSEAELQRAEAVVADVLGLTDYANELVVDELVRNERSEAADEEVAEVLDEAARLDSPPERSSSEADHLVEDPLGDLFGAPDAQRAITRGQSYEPPTRPVQDGSRSRENH